MCENTQFLRKLPYAAVPLNALLYTCMAQGVGLSCVVPSERPCPVSRNRARGGKRACKWADCAAPNGAQCFTVAANQV